MAHGAGVVRLDRLGSVKALWRWIVACVACTATLAFAQGYPARPVKVIVPFAPGGNIDVTTRILAEALHKQLGQPFIVENRAGAGGTLGADIVAKAEPDGYTLLASATGAIIVNPLMMPSTPYRLENFAPVGMAAVTPLVVEVPAASPHKDFASFAAYVHGNPGKVSIGHSGNGTSNHLVILLMQQAMKADFTVVPYKGSGPAIVDLLAGQLDSIVDQLPSSLPNIRAGKFRPLAISSKTRSKDLPDVPTLAESGLKDFDVVTSSGFLAPAKTPAPVIEALNAALNRVLADPAVVKRLADLGSEAKPGSPQQFDEFLKAESARLQPLAKAGVLRGD
jgi:tripartite-type tricarboxylate transporter receptor subunit TctC